MLCVGIGRLVWVVAAAVAVVVVSVAVGSAVPSKREADYTLDDSFWNEESPVGKSNGEVERLLRDHRQNQELVRNIGTQYYQIVYPVQLRHHEKMGISTREVGVQRGFPSRGSSTGGDQYSSSTRPRSRTGKHFHRTSLLIKAFNHKFRLDLELNTQLLAPNLIQKHFLPTGAESVTKNDIEHCYYHGTVKDYPGATAAFHTCNGVSGVIHLGNETFVIHPFYGGDLSKHPHVIFEARTKSNHGCGNTGTLEWRMSNRRQKHLSGLTEDHSPGSRYRRDVREATKYIETALVIDKAMFEKRNGSSRAEIVHDAIQVANIADLYFRTLNTRVSVVYIETWQGTNQASVDKNQDISRALLNFNDYTSRKLFKVDKDTTQLLTGETFKSGESGMAVPETVCTAKSVGISVDLNTYEPHLLAGTMAHMIGHNIGMGHDDGREECFCRDWHGCIMAKSIIGLENVQPYKFSECSRSDYIDALRTGHGICLLNKPNELEVRRTCGNNIVEEGEDCDCGTIDECHEQDPCCDPITCKLTKEAECASGPCCNNCRLRNRGHVCRDITNECDLPEQCTGETGQCPADIHKKNGNPCGNDKGYCFSGVCPTLNQQCEQIWGVGAVAGDSQCFDQFNSKGSINGHCGKDENDVLTKCDPENVRCGSLHCQTGARYPIITGMEDLFARTIISIKGVEYECKATSGSKSNPSEIPKDGLVRDGTPCGENLICVNQTCASIFPHIDQGRCPSNHNNLECSGHGVCSNVNKCYCFDGWSSADCSFALEITTPAAIPVTTASLQDNTTKADGHVLTRNVTPYENAHSTNTVFLVGMLMSVVGGVFIVFALMALCYRSVVVHRNFSLCLREHKLQKMKRMAAMNSGSEDDPMHSVGPPGNRRPMYPANDGGGISEVERTLKSLNGYHEDIMEALRNAASHNRGLNATPSGSSSMLSEEMLRKSIAECSGGYGDYKRSSQEKLGDGPQTHTAIVEGSNLSLHHRHAAEDDDEDDDVPPCGPIRIRNLEDLIRQLEHHSARHMSPSGSEDIRMSETEADRHYRLESHDPPGRRSREDDGSRFVYGRYRHPTGRHPPGYHQHNMHEEEGIYETADQVRGERHGDTPDSESDEFIQAQQQLVRSASEETLPVVTASTSGRHHHQRHRQRSSHASATPADDRTLATTAACLATAAASSAASATSATTAGTSGLLANDENPNVKREYFPSPPDTDDESSDEAGERGSLPPPPQQLLEATPDDSDDSAKGAGSPGTAGTEETALLRPKRYPEYKH